MSKKPKTHLEESDYNSKAFRATSSRMLPRTMEVIRGAFKGTSTAHKRKVAKMLSHPDRPLQKIARMAGPKRKKK